jgi:hypothetical protein
MFASMRFFLLHHRIFLNLEEKPRRRWVGIVAPETTSLSTINHYQFPTVDNQPQKSQPSGLTDCWHLENGTLLVSPHADRT